jgi:cytochrome d ubiquinol oxidase subunit II
MIHTIIAEAGGILPLLSALAIGLGVLLYVLLDGADLGSGILLAFFRHPAQREVIVDSIVPVWDANETWIVLVGGGTIALFPQAAAVLLTGLYLPVVAMLLFFACRGVAIEFRDHAETEVGKAHWDLLHMVGAIGASFCQGVILGAVVRGFPSTVPTALAAWFNWFAALCGIAFVFGYAFLGSAWLVWRSVGALQQGARHAATLSGAATLLFVTAITLLTISASHIYQEHWQSALGQTALAILIPGAVISIVWFVAAQTRRRDFQPLGATLLFFILVFVEVGVTLFPLIVPPALDTAAASSPPVTQRFVLIGYLFLVPVIVLYNTFGYGIFHGKVRPREETKAEPAE